MGSCKEKQAAVSFDNGPGYRSGAGRVESLYVHVPFCRARCRYCDFYSQVLEDSLPGPFVAGVGAELELHRDWLKRPLVSVYVGGGTPTVLAPPVLRGLLNRLSEWTDRGTEFSVEANPGTVSGIIAETLAAAGVNRVTLGAQSFDAGQLRLLGRIHRPRQIAQAVKTLRKTGIDNIGLDLMYGIPRQSLQSWRTTLTRAISLGPQHVSCYALSFEGGTPLEGDLHAGRIREVDDETQREMYYMAIDQLASAGLQQYEISNFARPNRQSRHNLTYWCNRPYLGLGPSACSYLDGQRRTNAPDLDAYLRCLCGDRPQIPPASAEHLTGRAAMAETLMLALRLTDGVEIKRFVERFGLTPAEAFPGSIARYTAQGALEVTPGHIRVSRRAMFTADTILADIIAEA